MLSLRNTLLFALMIAATVMANLLIKQGTHVTTQAANFFTLINWRIFFGLSSFGFGGLCLILLMQQLPLYIVQAFNALQYVAVILAAVLILHESVSLTRWLGIGLIITGIVVVGLSQKQNDTEKRG